MRFYIYGLTDPRKDNAVFYVGVSTNVPGRVGYHCTDRASAAYSACKSVRQDGHMVGYEILGGSLDKVEAKRLERRLIKHLPGLVNSTNPKAMLSQLLHPED